MKKLTPDQARELNLPMHEHHDLPQNKLVLNTLADHPGAWFHADWDEIAGLGDHETKRQALEYDAEFRNWTLHAYTKPGYVDGGLFLMRDLID